MSRRALGAWVLLLLLPFGSTQAWAQGAREDSNPVVVASKPFGESYLLAEMFAQLLEGHGIPVERRPGLGSTEIAFGALRAGAIDVYPEYTGTGLFAILHDTLPPEVLANPRRVFAHVAASFSSRFGVRWLPPSASRTPTPSRCVPRSRAGTDCAR